MSEIQNLAQSLVVEFRNNNQLFTSLKSELLKLTTEAQDNNNESNSMSYCFKFKLPIPKVLKFYTLLDLKQNEVNNIFTKDWEHPSNAAMYSDPYYQVLMTIYTAGIIMDDEVLKEKSLILIFIKLWNGRLNYYFPKFCKPTTMAYVVNNMCTNQHVIKKYENIYECIKQYFVPGIIKKYGNIVLFKNPKHTKSTFSQMWGRINQLFYQQPKVNLTTGKNEASGGILYLYKKAFDNGLEIKTSTVYTDSEDEMPAYDDYATVNIRDEIVKTTTDFITMNPNPKYPEPFIGDLYIKFNTRKNIIESILKTMHNHLYYDEIYDILTTILSKCNINEKENICDKNFENILVKNILKSKNNKDINQMNKILNNLTDKILQQMNVDFHAFSNVTQIKIRNIIIYGIMFNLKKHICKN